MDYKLRALRTLIIKIKCYPSWTTKEVVPQLCAHIQPTNKEMLTLRCMSAFFQVRYLQYFTQIEEGELRDVFSECGTVKSLNLKKKEDGFTFAYIEYEDAGSADKAIQKYIFYYSDSIDAKSERKASVSDLERSPMQMDQNLPLLVVKEEVETKKS